ncbi:MULTISPECIES: hypothetical protein [Natrinema]|uniref:Uncharacterized protein n=2 Tax=Natrinema TaxID=88723 RepID=L9YGF0_9EURY|nr:MULTISPECIES: hypothetical protein [Natrinema]ELY73200.1 hypothetical protein C487_17400 [Natrinema pallidum DSM 3751]ELY85043.1 hypothetical protein C486_00365 [Natrinema gari JCM 14663]
MSASDEVLAGGIRDLSIHGNSIHVSIPVDGVKALGYSKEELAGESVIVTLTESGELSATIPPKEPDKRPLVAGGD